MKTEIKATKTRTELILKVMYIIAWIAYIGFLIQTGTILISFGVSWFNPEAARDLYQGLDLYKLSQTNFWYYAHSVSFLVALTGMKAYVSSLAIKILSKVNLTNPFTMEVTRILEKMSHILFGIWMVGVINNGYASWLVKRFATSQGEVATGEFLFMAGLILIISQVFKRGVEIQSENELTV